VNNIVVNHPSNTANSLIEANVLGGEKNSATGARSQVINGQNSKATAEDSTALGSNLEANHKGSIILGDSNGSLSSLRKTTAENRMDLQFSNGVFINGVNVIGLGSAIELDFLSAFDATGFTTQLNKTGAGFWITENTWKDLTPDLSLVSQTGNVTHDNSNNEIDVSASGKYRCHISATVRRASGSTTRLLLFGPGINGANPVKFISIETDGNNWVAISSDFLLTLTAGDSIKLKANQINMGGTSVLDMNFAAIHFLLNKVS
jgi:hypothetical protein